MRAAHFTKTGWVKILRSRAGFDTCIPKDLPAALDFPVELLSTLSAADRAVGQLAGIMRALPNPRLLIRSFIGREAVLSSRIEGTQASLSDLFQFEVSPSVEERVPDVLEVHNYVRALDHGIQRLRQIPLSLNLVRELHGILLSGVRGAHVRAGEFRAVQNWIGATRRIEDATYVPPPPERLGPPLDALERFINLPSRIPLLVRIAQAHYQFEAIHPFEDGNGRVGRLIISLMLDNARAIPHPVLYLSAYFERHRDRYYRLLLGVSQRGEWHEWVDYFLHGVTQQSIDAVERSSLLVTLRNEWATKCQTARTSALLLRLVDGLFRNPFLTLASATRLLGTRAQSAQNNINLLIEHEILREVTGQKRNRVYAAPRIIDILEQSPAFDVVGQREHGETEKQSRRKP